MGIIINNFPVVNGIATVDGVYVKIRDLQTSKEDSTGAHNLSFRINITKNDTFIMNDFYSKNIFTGPLTENIWEMAYSLYKERLTSEGMTFTDQI